MHAQEGPCSHRARCIYYREHPVLPPRHPPWSRRVQNLPRPLKDWVISLFHRCQMALKQTFWCTSGSCVALGLFANPSAFMCSPPGRCWAEQLCLTSKLPSASWSLITDSDGLRINPKSCSSSSQRNFPSPFSLEVEKLPSASVCTKGATVSLIRG